MKVGRIIASVTIANATDLSRTLRCDALVDTGASHLVLPSAWKDRLGQFEALAVIEVETATQERVALQHSWAEMSEKLSDVIDPKIKYGGGNPRAVELLLKASAMVTNEETSESDLAKLEVKVSELLALKNLPKDKQRELIDLQRNISDATQKQNVIREEAYKVLQDAIEEFSKLP